MESNPAVSGVPACVTLGSWTDLPGENVANTMGTACYTYRFRLSAEADEWLLSLGDVRESARVRINGHDAGTLWAVPFRTKVGRWLHEGTNLIEVEVTNLPANRIADMDRRGVEWRIFEDINVAKLNYKKGTYIDWEPMPSGLNGTVRLVPIYYK